MKTGRGRELESRRARELELVCQTVSVSELKLESRNTRSRRLNLDN